MKMRENSTSSRSWYVHPVVLSLAGAVLLSVSFSLFPFFILIALLPCFELDYQLKEKGQGFLFFVLVWLSLLLFNAWGLRGLAPVSLSLWVVLVIAQALAMSLPFLLFRITRNAINEAYGYFSFALYWLSLEYFNLHSAYGWPQLVLGNAWAAYPGWVQWYEVTGVLGGSLWILCTNIWIYLALRSYFPVTRRAFGLYAVLVFAIVFVYSLYLKPVWEPSKHQFFIKTTFHLSDSTNARELTEKQKEILKAGARAVEWHPQPVNTDPYHVGLSPDTEWAVLPQDFNSSLDSPDSILYHSPNPSSLDLQAVYTPKSWLTLWMGVPRYGRVDNVVYNSLALLQGRLPNRDGYDPDCYIYRESLLASKLDAKRDLYPLAKLRAIESRRYILLTKRDGTWGLFLPNGDALRYTAKIESFPGPLPPNRTTLYALHGDYIGRLAWFLAIALFLSGLVRQKTRLNPRKKA